MRLQRFMKDGTPPEISVLALLNLAGAASALMAIVHPVSSHTPIHIQEALVAIAATTAIGLLVGGPRVGRLVLHAILTTDILLIGVMVAAASTERGMVVSSLVYVWCGIYAGLFLRPRLIRAYLTLMTVSFGVALLVARSPADVTIWVIVSSTVWIAVIVLSRLSERLRDQAHFDALTGLLNRNGFREAAVRERARAVRSGAPLTLAVIDLDGFKAVNDAGGHAAGDLLLAEIAQAWRTVLRPGDLLARHGGDEFVLLLPAGTEDRPDHVLDRLREAHRTPWTAGLVIWEHDESLEDCIARADQRLYAGKERHAITARRGAASAVAL
jgi:diguanylate cyclase (GGDEF)-like protein